MTSSWVVVAVTLASALAFSMSSSLKHASAGQVPDAQDLGARSLGRFVRATLAHPLWLGGIGADVVGLSLQVTALHLGALGVVQPLLISGLLFALLLRSRSGGHVSGRELGLAAVVSLTLVAFLVLAHTNNQLAPTDGPDRTPAIAAAVTGVVLAVVCVQLGRRQRHGGRSAALLGIAVGTIYAATAALLKALTSIALRGPLPLLTSWQLYAVLVVGAGGLLLNQVAFQAGPLSASLPAIATVDPLLSIAIGVIVYDEQIRHGLPAGVGLLLLLLILGGAVIALARSEATSAAEQVPRQP
ncbi:MAG: DMT family transporter [Mycobacteriaceae bacterium]